VWRSGRVVECNPEGRGSSPAGAAFDDSFVGKLMENCRETPSRENKKPSGNSDDFEIFRLHRRNSTD
jgi:hypothetical protein